MVQCPYCEIDCRLVSGAVIYPHRQDLADIKVWRCESCKARVGCHGKTDKPLGIPANKEDRKWRTKAHRAFDPIWRSGKFTRSSAYSSLAIYLRIDRDDCHMGRFDREMCQRVLGFVYLHSRGEL